MSSATESSVLELLESEIYKFEACPDFVQNRWKSLKKQMAVTRATDVAGVAAKLRVIEVGIEIEACNLDLDILRSAIADLANLSGIR
jgi:hypothetical protein